MTRSKALLLPLVALCAALALVFNEAFMVVTSPRVSHGTFAGRAQMTQTLTAPSHVEVAEVTAAAAHGEGIQQRATLVPPLAALLGFANAALARKRQGRSIFRRAGDDGDEDNTFKKLSTTFCNLFAIWLAIAAVAALKHPASFTWVKSEYFTGLLGLLMFSVGITTTIDDFRECLKRPGAVAINFISCYGIMPLLAFVLAKAIGAEGAILAGLVLVGSINGGQASNLCTLIAGGDVALSVPRPSGFWGFEGEIFEYSLRV